ncbi:putative siderophore transport system permease protein YfhA [Acaryochloris thomasi RCC1774]|uniref:Putative siderophore transport system permease protein YfhA n=1 Tax=Acaryochloris thomasi RCC1774 TaxID=1764569 RepID=A0A2W1JRB7_9CYAN|nr:iron ABC transporter permease [Acaryochloris thomasi]PZD72604.1 putative siderophore transport system permease protein YfhA [Acaryochloris thomasi RCC1774]
MKQQWLILRPSSLPISMHLDRRVPAIILGLVLVTLAAMVLSVGQGEYFVPPLDVIKTVLGLETDNPDYAFIVMTLRLPRTLVAWGVGMGLAIAGTITQGITRNPLASPGIIGVNAGASLAAVTLIVLYPELPIAFIPLAAFGGALTVAILIYLLAWKGGSSPVRLVLVGVGFSLIAGALTNLMVTFGNIYNVSQALVWLAGSVYGRSWEQLTVFAPWLLVFGFLSLLMSRELNALQLGDDIARSLGSRLEVQRGLLLLSSVALAGSSVATAGSISFVGLMAPHIGRQMVGPSHEGLLPVAALTGGLVVVVADLCGRLLFAPIELPCGIITAVIGAPYFLYLLIRDG